ncbi:MAG: hypothetical protein R6V00_02400, partial [Candidatus Aminicenantes bacterium]
FRHWFSASGEKKEKILSSSSISSNPNLNLSINDPKLLNLNYSRAKIAKNLIAEGEGHWVRNPL